MWGLPGRELGGGGGGGESKKASGPEEELAVYNERADGAELERTLDIALADVEGAETARGSAVQNRFWMVFIVGRGALMVFAARARRRGRRTSCGRWRRRRGHNSDGCGLKLTSVKIDPCDEYPALSEKPGTHSRRSLPRRGTWEAIIKNLLVNTYPSKPSPVLVLRRLLGRFVHLTQRGIRPLQVPLA